MDSYTKDTHRYAFELVKAARIMPVDMAEKLQHIKQMRFNYQLKALRKRFNKRITSAATYTRSEVSSNLMSCTNTAACVRYVSGMRSKSR